MAQAPKPSYDPDRHAPLPYVDKKYKVLLDEIAEKNHWTRKTAVELAIQHFANSHHIIP